MKCFKILFLFFLILTFIACCINKPDQHYFRIFNISRTSFIVTSKTVNVNMCFDNINCLLIKKYKSTGSGVIIAHDSNKNTTLILTAAHICQPDPPKFRNNVSLKEIFINKKITTNSNKSFNYKIVNYNTKHDICIIETKKINKPPIRITWTPIKNGERILNLSNINGLANGNTIPLFVGFYLGLQKEKLLNVYSLPVSSGSSGSMILNLRGELIGIVTHVFMKNQQICIGPSTKIMYKFIRDTLKKRNYLTLSFSP